MFCSLSVAGLGEFRIRDLNDEINKLLREKRHWEERIIELGGPDYNVGCVLYQVSDQFGGGMGGKAHYFCLFSLIKSEICLVVTCVKMLPE